MKKNPSISEAVSVRLAKARRGAQRSRIFRLLGARGAATLALGAALSIGGLADIVTASHFEVAKNLDSVQVVRRTRHDAAVVANLGSGFTGNTVFKLAQLLPDKYVTRELSLFDDQWLPKNAPKLEMHSKVRDVFTAEIQRINEAIREEFFSSAMPYGDLIHEKATKYDVDPALVAAVIEQESKFRSRAQSQVGARGLMQLMPRTGRWMGARDLYDPEQNVDAGVKYIKYLQGRFNGNLTQTIAAYNAGEGNVLRYRGVPPFRETRTYVNKVLKNYEKRNKQLKEFEQDRATGSGTVQAGAALAR